MVLGWFSLEGDEVHRDRARVGIDGVPPKPRLVGTLPGLNRHVDEPRRLVRFRFRVRVRVSVSTRVRVSVEGGDSSRGP